MSATVIDLFAGIGGLSEGFRKAGCSVVAAVEWDKQFAAAYEANHLDYEERPLVLCKDVRRVRPRKLMRRLGLKSEDLTFLVGGPPCQGFSTLGKRDPDDERNLLIFQFPRYLRVFKSAGFLIENVTGLTNFDGGSVLQRLLTQLRRAGYSNASYTVVDAAACGVPQRRRRVIIYGTRDGGLPDFDRLQTPNGTKPPTAWDAIGDLPNPEKLLERYQRGQAVPYARNAHSKYAKVMRGRAKKVSRWEPVRHSPAIVRSYRRLSQGETDPKTACWRMFANRPSRTLRAGTKDRTACRPVHPYQPRVITVREAARLHSWSDSTILPVSTAPAHVAIGNSVPPIMAAALAREFCRALDIN